MQTTKLTTWIPLSLCLLVSPVVLADSQWQSCDIKTKPSPLLTPTEKLLAGSIYLEADKALLRDEGLSELSGNVVFIKDGKQLISDTATFDRIAEKVIAKGNVKASTTTMELKSQQAEFNLKTDNSIITNAKYQLSQNGQGKSSSIKQYGKNVTHLDNATYSTCPVETPSWLLSSSKIKLHHDKEIGTARNVTLKVSKKNIPVFYFPYFSFPLTDKRKSGFLLPSYTSSDKSGFGVSLPYYFNLAPNYDYTVTPTYLVDRGLMLGNEFRYLTQNNNGVIHYDVLPNDDKKDKQNRYLYNVKHFTRLSSRTHLDLTAEGVSDSDYFDDFGSTLTASSRTELKRQLDINTTGNDWDFLGRIQNYQLLDGGTEPYARLPQVVFNYHPIEKVAGMDFSVASEFVYFDKQNISDVTTGSRFDISTKFSKTFSSLAYFVKPSLKLRHTQYDLDLNGNTGEKTPSRSLNTVSLDSGLFFEREFSHGNKVQTLEPRLFYTRTTFKDQSSIPIFDTAENSFSYSQLFSDNRFSGKDRIEDANRLSASLTSRVLDKEDGNELFRVSAGQLFHFDNRKVVIPGKSIETSTRSEFAIELSGQVAKNTRLSSISLWDADTNNFRSSNVQLHYKNDENLVLNTGYRYRENELEQSNLSFSIPVKNNVSLVGSWDHDLQNERDLETVVGVEYANCCVKSRLVARKYLTADNNSYDNAIFVEFEFKGLGAFGDPAGHILEDRIHGYN